MKTVNLKKGLWFLLAGVVVSGCKKDETTSLLDSKSTFPREVLMATSGSSTSSDVPIGFASVNGMTRGGAGGKTVTVTSYSALERYAKSYSPMIILVKGTIKGSIGITVRSNKTIIGLSGATLDGPGLLIYRASNIIIKNLTIKNARKTDGITIKDKSHHVWIDHCTFTNPIYDGNLDITREADYITVSWCKFSNSKINLLIGGSDSNTSDRGKLNVTLHHNYFVDNYERNPSVRFGRVHAFNNYYFNNIGTTAGYCLSSRMKAIVRAENNYFDVKTRSLVTMGPDYGYFSAVSTNVYKGDSRNRIYTALSSWGPSYSYKSVLIPAQDVPRVVAAGAGAS